MLDFNAIQRPDDERERNEKRTCKGGEEPCILCGRKTDSELFVHLSTSYRLISVGQEVDEASDQGWFPVGPECAKKLPAEYVSREVL